MLNRLLVRIVDVNETNDVIKIITKEFGLTWVKMDNHVEIHNRFFIPYFLEEVKLTYYNDSGINVGYLHFKGPVKIPAYQKRLVVMPSNMSNITALFNGLRLLISDRIKVRTVGASRIRFFGVSFELPIDDIMVIHRGMIVTEELDEAQKQRRREEKAEREKLRDERRAERKARREERRMKFKEQFELEKIRRNASAERRAIKDEARKRLERIRKLRDGRIEVRSESQPEVFDEHEMQKDDPVPPAVQSSVSGKDETSKKEAGSAGPGPDISCSDPSA